MEKFALLSVTDKTGIVEFAKGLADWGYTNITTGGTYERINEANVPVKKVEDITDFPEILEGRVKTLHPKIHAGILARRDNEKDIADLKKHGIPLIDIVAINLYPFEETMMSNASLEECIEQIDIGGVAAIRAAAKNYKDVILATNPEQYGFILDYLLHKGEVPLDIRMKLADEAFTHTARYDILISNWIKKQRGDTTIPKHFVWAFDRTDSDLIYGTNKHQEAALYKRAGTDFGLTTVEQYTKNGGWERITVKADFHGRALSFNNLVDAEVAINNIIRALVALGENELDGFELSGDDLYSIVNKHLNDCGNAKAKSALEAIKLATSGDPQSSFGGIRAVYGVVDEKAANEIKDGPLTEVIIALEYTKQGLDVLTKKKNIRILRTGFEDESNDRFKYRIGEDGGHLLLENKVYDLIDEEKLKVVAGDENFYKNNKDLIHFGIVTCQNKFSNTITLVEEVEEGVYRQVGFGAGNAKRVESVKQACELAEENLGNEFEEKTETKEGINSLVKYIHENTKCVNIDRYSMKIDPRYKQAYVKSRMGELILISDSFFPFADNIELANKHGIKNIVEDGGSTRDNEVIEAAQKYNMNILFTGVRYFRH